MSQYKTCVTKMATYHFPQPIPMRGSSSWGKTQAACVNFGAPGLGSDSQDKPMTRRALEKVLDFDLDRRVAIVTYHPVTFPTGLPWDRKEHRRIPRTHRVEALFTKANADSDGHPDQPVHQRNLRSHPESTNSSTTSGKTSIWAVSNISI